MKLGGVLWLKEQFLSVNFGVAQQSNLVPFPMVIDAATRSDISDQN